MSQPEPATLGQTHSLQDSMTTRCHAKQNGRDRRQEGWVINSAECDGLKRSQVGLHRSSDRWMVKTWKEKGNLGLDPGDFCVAVRAPVEAARPLSARVE